MQGGVHQSNCFRDMAFVFAEGARLQDDIKTEPVLSMEIECYHA